MMKKTVRICAIVLGSLLILAVAGYIALGYYYSPYFVYGTWINNVYCTGLDVSTVNQSLVTAADDYVLTIEEQDGQQEIITGQQINYDIDYLKQLQEIKAKQNPFNWGYYWFYPMHIELEPVISYDEELLKQAVMELDCSHLQTLNEKLSPVIQKKSGVYILVDERTEVIDYDRLYEAVANALTHGASSVSLSEEECYYMPELTKAEQATYDIWQQIERAQKTSLLFQDGAQKCELDGKEISDWISLDEQGEFLLEQGKLIFDTEKTELWIEKLAAVFNTKGNVRTWTRKDGKVITITSKGKGYVVDEEAEQQEILHTLKHGSKITRKPLYSQVGEPREAIDMGKTYIEVDMTAQKLYYYKNDELKLATDIVTGNLARGHDTPAALCELYYMQRNRTLHGANYESFVYYWMAVKGRIGIHDATWRDKFGGDIYKTAGSHGCINLPKEKAAELYGMVEVGIPVIMYY